MLKPRDLEFAVDQTLYEHPEFGNQMVGGFIRQINDGVNPKMYTRKNGARQIMSEVTKEELLKYFLDEAIKIFNAASYYYWNDETITKFTTTQDKMNYLSQIFPYFGPIQKLITIISDPKVNSSLYIKTNNNELISLVTSVLNTKIFTDRLFREYIDQNGRVESVLPNGKVVNLFAKFDEDAKRVASARNIQVNHNSINKCFSELMSGNQLRNQRNEYALDGTLYATQDIGKGRPNQEDSVIILTHPENPDFKLLAVSDGMGGVDKGEKASSYIIQKISTWFSSLPADSFYYADQVQQAFNNEIAEASNDIYQTYNADFNRIVAGATFVGAIVTSDKTIVSSVGDSRAYATDGTKLNLITRDESAVWPPRGTITEEALDDLRFNKRNNVITRCIGQPLTNVQSTIIRNDDYLRLILTSDGVTDLLTTERIRFIALNSSPELLTKYLVEEALTYDAVRLSGETPEYNGAIRAGKDNATAAAFIRR